MIANEGSPPPDGAAGSSTSTVANDNDGAVLPVIDDRILMIARAIGRQIGREHLKAMQPDNDNDSEDTP